MERKKLVEKLEFMKKELARKQKKLEKAERAARVKAHVKQKIQELNGQRSKEESTSTSLISSSSNKVDSPCGEKSRETALVSNLERKKLSIVSNKTKDHSVNLFAKLETGLHKVPSECSDFRKQKDIPVKLPVIDIENNHEGIPSELHCDQNKIEGKEINGGPLCDTSDVEDSFAITPTFRSMRNTSENPKDSYVPDMPSNIYCTDLDSFATLNLHTDERYEPSGMPEESQNTQSDKSDSDTQTVKNQIEKSFRNANIAMEMGTEAKNEGYEFIPQNAPSTKSASEVSLETDSAQTIFPLKLQDIGSEKKDVSQEQIALSADKPSQLEHSFLDYTELDAIPFSQFELTEDFLSSDPWQSASQSKRKKRFSGLVQRKSPRLSSFDVDSCEKTSLTLQQSKLFSIVKKQKKTQKALLISSAFQYLIDEAKRDSTVKEFKLPDNLAIFASSPEKEKTQKKHKEQSPLEQERCDIEPGDEDVQIPDIEIIPETELIPELSSQTSETDSHSQSCRLSERAFEHKIGCERNSGLDSGCIQVHCIPEEIKIESFSKPEERFSFKGDHTVTPVSESVQDCNVGLQTHSDILLNQPAKKLVVLDKRESRAITVHHEDFCVEEKEDNQNGNTQSMDQTHYVKDPEKSLLENKLLSTPKSSVQTSVYEVSSPILFDTQSECVQDNRSEGRKPRVDISACANGFVPCSQSGTGEQKSNAIFTPSKVKPCSQKVETCGPSWVKYAGCAESGCKDSIIETIVGTVAAESEETSFILSVQPTLLTLWTLENTHCWSAEFHWYLPHGKKTQGACRVHTSCEHLAVLLWGTSGFSDRPFLMMFVYTWDTQHTHRFSLSLPSPVTPERVFCHGIPYSHNTVLVFATDKAYSRGKKYMADLCDSCVREEFSMAEIDAQLVDVHLVQDLPVAVAGFSMEQKLYVWNHTLGTLILTLDFPDTIPSCSRMFSTYAFQGYLLLHTAELSDPSQICLVAVNPLSQTGTVVKRFTSQCHTGKDTGLPSVAVDDNYLMLTSEQGTLDIWDASTAKSLVSCNSSAKIHNAKLMHTRDSSWLLTGQRNGCLHMYLLDNVSEL